MNTAPPCTRLLLSLLVSLGAVSTSDLETASQTATMLVARSGHQATLLIDGRVLASGGSDERGQAIGAAEIFNPITGIWSVAAANLIPRLGHSATLLHDGRVLVVGGVPFTSSCEPVQAAELYDPSTDRWSMTSNPPVPVGRGTVAVTLDDGRVLVVGGGTACGAVYSSAALFDPSSNTWSQTSPIEAPALFNVAARLSDSRILVSGAATSVYDPRTSAWSSLGDPRSLADAPCEGQGRLFAGALRRGSVLARATPEDCPSVTVLPGGTLMVAGGFSASNVALDSVRLFDLRTGAEERSWDMSAARAGHTATRLGNGAVLIAGGRNGAKPIANSEIYLPRLPYETSGFGIWRGGIDALGAFTYGTWLAAATNSQNHLLVSYSGATRAAFQLLEWAPSTPSAGSGSQPEPRTGIPGRYLPYVRSLGDNLPVLNSIRVDERDNIWAVSSEAQEIFKISPDGQVLLRFGRQQAQETAEAGEPPRGPAARGNVDKPADIAWDKDGHVFVTDAGDRPRILKFDSRGRFLAATGQRGSRPGELDGPHSMATDASGNVYVADSGNARIQVFDNNLNFRGVYGNIGTPWAICITNGPRQFLYSVSNPDKSERNTRAPAAEIYKLETDGTILGRAVGDEATRNIFALDHIHCRQANTIFGLGYRNFHVITFAR